MEYPKYLTSLKSVDDPLSMHWNGAVYLPPCSCSSPLQLKSTSHPTRPCPYASSTSTYDFKSTNDINLDQLTDLCKYVKEGSNTRSECGYWLCEKYSLHQFSNEDHPELKIVQSDTKEVTKSDTEAFTNSDLFRSSVDLLRSDIQVLSVFNRSKVTFVRKAITKHHIKYIIKCGQGTKYRPYEQRKCHKVVSKPRNGETSKPTVIQHKCNFGIALFFDLKMLRWFIRVSNNTKHEHHYPTEFNNFKIQQRHMTTSMQRELSKLNNANTPTTTIGTILMENNDVVLGRHTLYNNKILQRNDELGAMTDCEMLLDALQKEKDVTYFSIFAHSAKTPLLTVSKSRKARQTIRNQKYMDHIQKETRQQINTTDHSTSILQHSNQQTKMTQQLRHTYRGDIAAHLSQMNYPYIMPSFGIPPQTVAYPHNNVFGVPSIGSTPLTQHHHHHVDNLQIQQTIPTMKNEPSSTFDNSTNDHTTSTDDVLLGGIFNSTSNNDISKSQTKFDFTPNIDTADRKLLKEILVREKDSLYDKDGEVKVLLSCGWARNDDLAILRKFPEVVHMDTTFGTNKEGRPLFNIVVKDSNNKLCTVFRCILPSEKRCIFNAILSSALPQFLGKETCDRVQYIVTDGDSQEIEAVRSACKRVFKNAHRNVCFWHMIILGVNSKSKIKNHRLLQVLRSWLWFIATNTETDEERKSLLAHLKVCVIICCS